LITTLAKKVGGPLNFCGILVGAGIVVGGATVGAIKCKKNLSENKRNEERSNILYTVVEEGVSNEGVHFYVGDQFRVWNVDGDAVLIEKIHDTNNPYFVSGRLLKNISNYN